MDAGKGVAMTDVVMKRASLAEIRRMKEAGDLHHSPAAPEGEDLGPEFWAKAQIAGAKADPVGASETGPGGV